MEKLELDIGCEKPVFDLLIVDPKKVLILPKGYYEKLMQYLLQEEMYEYIPKLESIKGKISDKTLDEMLEECQLFKV